MKNVGDDGRATDIFTASDRTTTKGMQPSNALSFEEAGEYGIVIDEEVAGVVGRRGIECNRLTRCCSEEAGDSAHETDCAIAGEKGAARVYV